MKQLTKDEIRFIKETGWTPTVQQANEWERTVWGRMVFPYVEHGFSKERDSYNIKCLDMAYYKAMEYGIDLTSLYGKCTDESDAITLEYDATYLFYTFFTKEQLEDMNDESATRWLKDFKYYFGYRKWDGGNMRFVNEALEVYNGYRVFYLEDDGSVGNISHDEYPNSWVWSEPERILKI